MSTLKQKILGNDWSQQEEVTQAWEDMDPSWKFLRKFLQLMAKKYFYIVKGHDMIKYKS